MSGYHVTPQVRGSSTSRAAWLTASAAALTAATALNVPAVAASSPARAPMRTGAQGSAGAFAASDAVGIWTDGSIGLKRRPESRLELNQRMQTDRATVGALAKVGALRPPILSWAAEAFGAVDGDFELAEEVLRAVAQHGRAYVREGALLGIGTLLERHQDGEVHLPHAVAQRLRSLLQRFTRDSNELLREMARETLADL